MLRLQAVQASQWPRMSELQRCRLRLMAELAQPLPGACERFEGDAAHDEPAARLEPERHLFKDRVQPAAAAADEDRIRVRQAGKGLRCFRIDQVDVLQSEANEVLAQTLRRFL